MKAEIEFERRLQEILTDYPDIDPARAALALKGQPEATNEQIAQLSKFRPGEAAPSSAQATESGTSRPAHAAAPGAVAFQKNRANRSQKPFLITGAKVAA